MIEPLRTKEQPVLETERQLTEEEGWDLLMSMRGMLTGAFDKYGRSEAWLRRFREDDEGAEQ